MQAICIVSLAPFTGPILAWSRKIGLRLEFDTHEVFWEGSQWTVSVQKRVFFNICLFWDLHYSPFVHVEVWYAWILITLWVSWTNNLVTGLEEIVLKRLVGDIEKEMKISLPGKVRCGQGPVVSRQEQSQLWLEDLHHKLYGINDKQGLDPQQNYLLENAPHCPLPYAPDLSPPETNIKTIFNYAEWNLQTCLQRFMSLQDLESTKAQLSWYIRLPWIYNSMVVWMEFWWSQHNSAQILRSTLGKKCLDWQILIFSMSPNTLVLLVCESLYYVSRISFWMHHNSAPMNGMRIWFVCTCLTPIKNRMVSPDVWRCVRGKNTCLDQTAKSKHSTAPHFWIWDIQKRDENVMCSLIYGRTNDLHENLSRCDLQYEGYTIGPVWLARHHASCMKCKIDSLETDCFRLGD